MKKIILGMATIGLMACTSGNGKNPNPMGDKQDMGTPDLTPPNTTPPDMTEPPPVDPCADGFQPDPMAADACNTCWSGAQTKASCGPCVAANAACNKNKDCKAYQNCLNNASSEADTKACRASAKGMAITMHNLVSTCLVDACRDICGYVDDACYQCLQGDDSANCMTLDTSCQAKPSCKTSEDCFDGCARSDDACFGGCQMSIDPDYTTLAACLQDQCIVRNGPCASQLATYACTTCENADFAGKDAMMACSSQIKLCQMDTDCKKLYECASACNTRACKNDCVATAQMANIPQASAKKYDAINTCARTKCSMACKVPN